MKRSDFLSSIPTASFASYRRYRLVLLVRSRGHGAGAREPGLWSAAPQPHSSTETTGSPRFLGNPCQRAPLLDPGGPTRPHRIGAGRCCLPTRSRSSATTGSNFRGSVTQPVGSLSTLRRPGYPDATQDLLPARWLGFGRVGLSPTGSLIEFQISRHLSSSRTRLLLAQ